MMSTTQIQLWITLLDLRKVVIVFVMPLMREATTKHCLVIDALTRCMPLQHGSFGIRPSLPWLTVSASFRTTDLLQLKLLNSPRGIQMTRFSGPSPRCPYISHSLLTYTEACRYAGGRRSRGSYSENSHSLLWCESGMRFERHRVWQIVDHILNNINYGVIPWHAKTRLMISAEISGSATGPKILHLQIQTIKKRNFDMVNAMHSVASFATVRIPNRTASENGYTIFQAEKKVLAKI